MSLQNNEAAVSAQEDIWQPTTQKIVSFEINPDAYYGFAGQFVEEAVRESECNAPH